MTYRKRVEWPPHVRQMMHEGVRETHEAASAARDRFKIRVYVAVEQGVTTREIADKIGMSQAMISRYRIEGEALYRARQV